jgi:hypothetical protein
MLRAAFPQIRRALVVLSLERRLVDPGCAGTTWRILTTADALGGALVDEAKRTDVGEGILRILAIHAGESS